MYFWNFGDFQVVGASPEILVRQERIVDNGVPKSQITIRPLAGTASAAPRRKRTRRWRRN